MKRGARSIVRPLVSEFRNTGIMVLARSLIYPTFISLVPCLAIVYTVLNLLGQVQNFVQLLTVWFSGIFGEETGVTLMQYLQDFTQNATGMGIIGLASFSFTFMLLADKVWGVYNSIFKTSGGTMIAKRFVMYVMFLAIAVVVIAIVILMRSFLTPIMLKFSASENAVAFASGMKKVLAWGGTFAILTFMVKALPSCHVRFVPAAVGSAFSTALVMVLNMVFKFAARFFVSYSVIYGSIATVLLFIVFVNYLWVVILLGVLLTYVIQFRPSARSSDSKRNAVATKLAESLDVMLLVCRNYRRSMQGMTLGEIETSVKMDVRHLKSHLQNAVEIGFLKYCRQGGRHVYMPAKPVEYMDIAELAEKEFGIVSSEAGEVPRLAAVKIGADGIESVRGITMHQLISDGDAALIGERHDAGPKDIDALD